MIEINKFFNNYFKAFLLVLILTGIGFILNLYFDPKIYHLPKSPYNIYILAFLIPLLVFICLHFKKNNVIIWFSKNPVFIIAFSGVIIFYSIIFLLQNNIIQISHPLFVQVFKPNGWVFGLLNLFLLITLLFSIIYYLIPVRIKYLGTILFRLGLTLILIAFWFGKPDKQKIQINLIENDEKNNIGLNYSGQTVELPFAIKLIDFDIPNKSYSVFSTNHWKNLYFSHIKKIPDMQSRIVLIEDSVISDTLTITLYESINRYGWNIYQKGFDESKGKQSTLSILEAEKRPWKKLSTIGIYSLLTGIIFLVAYRKPKIKHTRYSPAHHN